MSLCGCKPDCGCEEQELFPPLKAISGATQPLVPPPPSCECKECGCGSDSTASAGPGSGSDLPVLTPIAAAVVQARAAMLVPLPPVATGAGTVNLSTGNLAIQLAPPPAGSMSPQPQLTYNSQASATSIQFGAGVAERFNPTVEEIDSDSAFVTHGTGSTALYEDKDGSGVYLAPAGIANSLKKNGDGTWTETAPSGFAYRYDTNGDLAKLVHPAGDVWTILRDADRLSALVGPDSSRTTYAYNGSNMLKRITDPAGRITSFTIDADKRLTDVNRPDGTSIGLRYNSDSTVKAYIDAGSNRTSYSYDYRRQVRRVTAPSGGMTTYVYDPNLEFTAIIDPANQRTTYLYDPQQRTKAVINASGERTTFVYSTDQFLARINPLGHRTSLTWAVLDNRTELIRSVTTPLGYRSTFSYDSSSRLKTFMNPQSAVTTLVWDASANRVGVINPEGNRYTTVYDGTGLAIASIDPYGRRTTAVYDASGNTIAVIDALSARTTYAYNTSNAVRRITNPLNQKTTFMRDTVNRVVATINPLGNRTTVVYDSRSNPKAMVNPLGQRSTTVYNALNQRVAVINPLGDRHTTVYDSRGLRTATIDALGNRQTTVYSVTGRPIAQINPLSIRVTTAYDAAGNRIRQVSPGNMASAAYAAEEYPAASGQGAGGDAAWQNAANATGNSPTTYTSVAMDDRDVSNVLRLTDYGFSLSGGSVVNGITAVIKTTGSDNPRNLSQSVKITKNGTTSAGTGTITAGTWSGGQITVGGASSLWGTTWTASEINSTSFGLLIEVEGDDDDVEFRVWTAEVEVAYTAVTGQNLVTTFIYDTNRRLTATINPSGLRNTTVYGFTGPGPCVDRSCRTAQHHDF